MRNRVIASFVVVALMGSSALYADAVNAKRSQLVEVVNATRPMIQLADGAVNAKRPLFADAVNAKRPQILA